MWCPPLFSASGAMSWVHQRQCVASGNFWARHPTGNRSRLAITHRRLRPNRRRLTKSCHRQSQAVLSEIKEKRGVVFLKGGPAYHGPGMHSKGRGLRSGPQRRLGRRLEEVAKAVGGGDCRLLMPFEAGACRQGDGGWA